MVGAIGAVGSTAGALGSVFLSCTVPGRESLQVMGTLFRDPSNKGHGI